MSPTSSTPEPTTEETARRRHQFSVDGKHFESADPTLTGAQIKAIAQVDPQFGLFLEGRGHDPDRKIADDEVVDLREPGRERLYTVPPATYG